MFVGHFGVAQIGKSARREVPVPWLIAAAYLPDLVRIVLQPLTSEHEVLSHSIPAMLVMGLLLGGLWKARGRSFGGSVALAVVCLLHWPADVFTGCKPTTLDGPWIGLLSYRHPVSDLALEGSLLIGGWLLLRRADSAFPFWWVIGAFAMQLGFLISMYWGGGFYIGHREWAWNPQTSLTPTSHVYEPQVCKPQSTEPP